MEGCSFLIKYTINNCITCAEKNKIPKLKREPSRQILTFYPKQKYIFYSKNEELFHEVLANIKNSFIYIGKEILIIK